MSDMKISAGDLKNAFCLRSNTHNVTFEPTILKEVKTSMMGKECVLPAVEHPHHDALTSFFAVVIKLHERVEVLEAELKQHKEGKT